MNNSTATLKPIADKNLQTQEVWYQLSRAYSGVGKTAAAAAALQHSRTTQQDFIAFQAAQEKLYDNVKNIAHRLEVARLCIRNNQPLKAMAHYRILLSQDPQNAIARQEMTALEKTLSAQGRGGELMAYEDMLNAGVSRQAEKPK